MDERVPPPEQVSPRLMITPPWLKNAGVATTTAPPPGAARLPNPYVPDRELTILPVVDKPLSQQDKMKCEEFCRQYIIDFNQRRSALRMGYSDEIASKIGNQLFWLPYTQAYLVSLIRNLEERCIVGRNEVLAGLLREANRFDVDASSSSRIAAWREIGRILGMYVNRIEISANSSGVMEVPMAPNSEAWEAVAAGAQTELMRQVRQ